MSDDLRHPSGFSGSELFYSGEHSIENQRNQRIVPAARLPFSGSPSSVTDNYAYQLFMNSNQQYPLVVNNPNPNNLNPDISSLESQFSCLDISNSGGGSLNNPWIDSSLMGPQFSLPTDYDPLYEARYLQWLSAIAGQNTFSEIQGINSLNPNDIISRNNSRFTSSIIRPPLSRNQNRGGVDIAISRVCRDVRSDTVSNGSGSLINSDQRGIVMGSLRDFRGKIYLLTKSPKGCNYLTRKFQEKDPQEIELFYEEVKDYVREIMLEKDGSVLLQKFFDVCTEDNISNILNFVFSDEHYLVTLCLDPNGTHAIQKLLEVSSEEQRRGPVISVIVRIAVTLSTNMYGNHVMQKCLRYFSDEEIKSILNVIADNCVDISRDKSGCCVMQQCLAHAQRLPNHRLISQVVSNALLLSDDPFGNYVVQFLTQFGEPGLGARVLDELKGNFMPLSMSKFGSNVVQSCILYSTDYNSCDAVIRELIRSSPDFLMLAQHPYGNYVIQSALSCAKGNTKRDITNMIHFYHAFLQSHPHGKRVLDITRGRKPYYRFQNHQQLRFILRNHQN